MARKPLEHLILFTVVATDGQESLIVQLAWEILSISKNQVLAKEQVYVCPGGGIPVVLPPGILPEAIQAAGNLDSALKQFHSTLSNLGGGTFSLMTFGPTPLRGLLHPLAYKICLSLQKYLHRYLDVVKEFCKVYPSTPSPPTSVTEMAECLGIHIEGTVNPGLEELSVVAQVAQKLIAQGCHFQSQEIIREDIKLDMTPDHNLVKEGCVVRLRGLPFKASLKDVSGFLSGLNCIPGGIVFAINSAGRRTGEAIAALENTEQALLALRRHHHYLNQRYVEVYEATPKDFSRITGGMDGGEGASNVCVARMQGLPYHVEDNEIVKFFEPNAEVKFGEEGVFIVHYADGKATGDGFALFNNEHDLTCALSLNKSMIRSRYVELFKSSLKEFKMVLVRSGTPQELQRFSDALELNISAESSGSGIEGMKGPTRNCVRLRGVPYSRTPEDIVEFFGDLKDEIATEGVHVVLNAVNRPTGQYYVQMKSEEVAKEASKSLHKKYMDSRYVEVFQCSGDEVIRGIQENGTGRYDRGYRDYGGGGGGGGGGERSLADISEVMEWVVEQQRVQREALEEQKGKISSIQLHQNQLKEANKKLEDSRSEQVVGGGGSASSRGGQPPAPVRAVMVETSTTTDISFHSNGSLSPSNVHPLVGRSEQAVNTDVWTEDRGMGTDPMTESCGVGTEWNESETESELDSDNSSDGVSTSPQDNTANLDRSHDHSTPVSRYHTPNHTPNHTSNTLSMPPLHSSPHHPVMVTTPIDPNIPSQCFSSEEGDPLVNQYALARWPDDGWYYRGLIVCPIGQMWYQVKDASHDMEKIHALDIIIDQQDAMAPLQVGDTVVALHPNYGFSYAPGKITGVVSDGIHFSVELYDGTRNFVRREDIYRLAQAKYLKDVEYLRMKEKAWVGQSVVARRDSDGLYLPGEVVEQSGLCQYLIRWTDGKSQVQEVIHMYGSLTKKRGFYINDHVLALAVQSKGIYMPGTIQEKVGQELLVQFCDGQNSPVNPVQCFWLSSEYYQEAVEFIATNVTPSSSSQLSLSTLELSDRYDPPFQC